MLPPLRPAAVNLSSVWSSLADSVPPPGVVWTLSVMPPVLFVLPVTPLSPMPPPVFPLPPPVFPVSPPMSPSPPVFPTLPGPGGECQDEGSHTNRVLLQHTLPPSTVPRFGTMASAQWHSIISSPTQQLHLIEKGLSEGITDSGRYHQHQIFMKS